ncbi:MAG: PQQ-binding-like beta-propeller repeat protein [Pirellulales bacterium]
MVRRAESRLIRVKRSTWGLVVLLVAVLSTFAALALDSQRTRTDRTSTSLKTVRQEREWGVAGAATSLGRDWPTLFGPHANGNSLECGLSLPDADDWSSRRCWERPIGSGYSSPIAVDGTVYVWGREGDEEVLEALKLEGGRTLWRTHWPTGYRGRYQYSDGPYSTPVATGDWIVAVGAEGRLVCVQRHDGRVVWERELRIEFGLKPGEYPFGAGMLIDDDRIFLNVGVVDRQAGVVALERTTGKTLWTATDHRAAFTTPRLWRGKDATRLLVLTDAGLAALDPVSGAECWTYPFRSRVADTVTAVSPLLIGDHVLLVAGQGAGAACLHLQSDGRYEVVWKDRRVLDSVFNTLVLDGDRVLGFGAMRQGGAPLRAIQWRTGRLLWEAASELDRGQALAADGWLLAIGERGHLGSMRLEGQDSLSLQVSPVPLLAAPCYSAPCLHRGRLVVRSERQVVCFDLRP